MRTFTFYTEDRRYTVPQPAFVTVTDEQRARQIASRRLKEAPDHLAIEVCEEGRVLFVLRRQEDADRTWSPDGRNGA